ncbi:MAG: small multi-drug export protein [Candidatus Omnitrophica bacterium]|nr:small multi-drug export protein [Candidatus Omnitrophota bacterium]
MLSVLPAPLVTVLVGALPIAEVRGAIPVGIALKLSYPEAFFWSVLGNLLPVIPLLLFLDPVSERLRRFKLWRRFFEWLFDRARKKGGLVERYEALGLAIFVAIPLPLTGAWTGCAAASLFKLPFRLAFPAIAAGVLLAGLVVSLAVFTGMQLFFQA